MGLSETSRLTSQVLFVLAMCAVQSVIGQAVQQTTSADAGIPQDQMPPEWRTNEQGNGARLFEAVELDYVQNLSRAGVTVYTPAPELSASTEDLKIAMNLGMAVAGALSSVVNRDQAVFLEYARIVHDYGDRLGVEESILEKHSEIVTAVKNGDWDGVATLIYRMKDDIATELEEVDMRDAAVLAMVTGWLEALYIVAKSLEEGFSADANSLLQDIDFVRYLQRNLDSLGVDSRKRQEVGAILAGLPKIGAITGRPPGYRYTTDDAHRIVAVIEPLRGQLR